MMFRRSLIDLVFPEDDETFRLHMDFYAVVMAQMVAGLFLIDEALYSYRQHDRNSAAANPVLGGRLHLSSRNWQHLRRDVGSHAIYLGARPRAQAEDHFLCPWLAGGDALRRTPRAQRDRGALRYFQASRSSADAAQGRRLVFPRRGRSQLGRRASSDRHRAGPAAATFGSASTTTPMSDPRLLSTGWAVGCPRT
jgi:hypothetical protein